MDEDRAKHSHLCFNETTNFSVKDLGLGSHHGSSCGGNGSNELEHDIFKKLCAMLFVFRVRVRWPLSHLLASHRVYVTELLPFYP